jgi:hypothetical protein
LHMNVWPTLSVYLVAHVIAGTAAGFASLQDQARRQMTAVVAMREGKKTNANCPNAVGVVGR